ncbi:MAG: alpha/beta hydrolase, partial [Myxococcota bacterium]
MLRPLIPILTLLTSSIAWATPPSQVSFPSADALPVTADVYAPHSSEAPTIVLFHQAGWSRGEYAEIAPKLNTMGFNCIAIDQRSGDGVGGVKNQTSRAAKQKKLGTRYVDARQDIVAALRYAKKRFGTPVLAWGSSYSSSLALHIAGSEPGLVDGVLAFSPGEYFSGQGKGSRYVTEAARKIQVPAFLTS